MFAEANIQIKYTAKTAKSKFERRKNRGDIVFLAKSRKITDMETQVGLFGKLIQR